MRKTGRIATWLLDLIQVYCHISFKTAIFWEWREKKSELLNNFYLLLFILSLKQASTVVSRFMFCKLFLLTQRRIKQNLNGGGERNLNNGTYDAWDFRLSSVIHNYNNKTCHLHFKVSLCSINKLSFKANR